MACQACERCARAGARPGCQQSGPVIRGIVNGVRSEDFGLTVTTLLACPRKRRLMQETDYWLRPKDSWWSYRGQLMHGVSEQYAGDDPNLIAETRFTLAVRLEGIGSVNVSGQPDLVDGERGHLTDYKTTKRVPGPRRYYACPETNAVIQYGYSRKKKLDCPHCGGEHPTAEAGRLSEARAYPHHVQQVNLYAYLLRANGIDIKTADIIYMDMEQQLRLPVELLPAEQVAALLAERARLHSQPALPDILQEAETVWECNYCPVRAACEQLHGGPVGQAVPAWEAAADQ